MTRQKKGSKVQKQPSPAELFRALTPEDQEKVIHYFNLHNAAIWMYSQLTEEAMKYVTYCIRLSQDADYKEKKLPV